ncbi:hypothetical protein LTSERUB_3279 [Salmonella enterica subsp. enterica serovar Rubislaw str. A4-653]|uniref:Uncharacterized protein n=1 Tax=Salmonella enterica subsp. enterica serovar Rubislaw str. A4-653 TaxID=913081 RepID=G5QKR0_SALRU|nr:hypothetical protein LTSERUB_3279 [Salmonella enterica subsp. enterica serovar Rubislaw str. A4-653]
MDLRHDSPAQFHNRIVKPPYFRTQKQDKNCYEILNAHAQLLYISLSLMLDVYTGY